MCTCIPATCIARDQTSVSPGLSSSTLSEATTGESSDNRLFLSLRYHLRSCGKGFFYQVNSLYHIPVFPEREVLALALFSETAELYRHPVLHPSGDRFPATSVN